MSSPFDNPSRAVADSATVAAYGRAACDKRSYRPLETVKLKATARRKDDKSCVFVVRDPEGREYLRLRAELSDGEAEASFLARGMAGVHSVSLHWSDEPSRSRHVEFRVEPETFVKCGDRALDGLFKFTKDLMLLGRRDFQTPRGRFSGYSSGAASRFDGVSLRDWLSGAPAFLHWETRFKESVEIFLGLQDGKGFLPDGMAPEGSAWPVSLDPGDEFLAVFAVHRAWQSSGDVEWLARQLPRLEKALFAVLNSPARWDEKLGLVLRRHSCDVWAFDSAGAAEDGSFRRVAATCDQAACFAAFLLTSSMRKALGDETVAREWRERAASLRERAVKLLWDGGKFLHHLHVDKIEHGSFDEAKQLAMGNVAAISCGLADAEQARSIIAEYERRCRATGDAFPWWSLQPGYPWEMRDFFGERLFEGVHANGGLLPQVGGELALAAFKNGRERYGVALLLQYLDFLERNGGAQAWHWFDGQPGMRGPDETNYCCASLTAWIAALFEGLAGIEPRGGAFEELSLSPRWASFSRDDVSASSFFPSCGAYAASRMRIDRKKKRISLLLAGTMKTVDFAPSLPDGWTPKRLLVNGAPVEFTLEKRGESLCLKHCLAMPCPAGLLELEIEA